MCQSRLLAVEGRMMRANWLNFAPAQGDGKGVRERRFQPHSTLWPPGRIVGSAMIMRSMDGHRLVGVTQGGGPEQSPFLLRRFHKVNGGAWSPTVVAS